MRYSASRIHCKEQENRLLLSFIHSFIHYIMSSIRPPLFYLDSSSAIAPRRGSSQAAGWDLFAKTRQVIPARGRAKVETGVSIALQEGTYGRVAPRSGTAVNFGLDVGAGVIDQDYRGTVQVLLFNHSDADFTVNAGERVAQLIVERISTDAFQQVFTLEDLSITERGSNGFGSTGR